MAVGIEKAELREIREFRWDDVLQAALRELGKDQADIENDAKGIAWKIAIASRLRRHAGTPHRSIAQALNMGKPASVRVYLCREN